MAEYVQLPSDDPTSYTVEELTKFVNEAWEKIRLLKNNGGDPVQIENWQIKLAVVRKELKERDRHKIQQPKSQGEIWPELISAKDALNSKESQQDWVYEDCLAAGSISILVAKPKTGKTYFAVNLALAVARGWPFLNRGADRGPVGYLSLDASLPDLMDVFRKFNLKEEDQIFIHAGHAPTEAATWALEAITKHNLRLIVVDTLQRMFRFQNINDYSEVSNKLQPFLEKAQTAKCHVMFTHHAGKEDKDDLDSAIGSSALRGLAYSYLHLKRLQDSQQRIFRSDQRGGKNFDEIAISDGSEGWIEKMGGRMEAEINEAERPILEFLQEESGATEPQIRLAIPLKHIIVSKALRQLLKANAVERTGKGKRGDAFKYYLAGTLKIDENEVKIAPELFVVPRFGTRED